MSHSSGWRRVHLRDVAEVRTGVSKNSKRTGNLAVRPYLRVANVQDGHLDLREVKTIAVTQADVGRYELRVGDVLMTEGGDFDKLGRGTVWRGEIPGCLHQNHVFAVRPDQSQLLPEFLAAWTTSSVGRRYFAKCSKQTTNLASINSSQVKAAPIDLPPLATQKAVVRFLSVLDAQRAKLLLVLKTKRTARAALRHKLMNQTLRLRDDHLTTWPTLPIGSLASLVQRRVGEFPAPTLTCSGARGLIEQSQFFGRRIAASDRANYCLLRRGEFSYNRSSMGGYPFGAIKRLDAYDWGALSTLNICFAIDEKRWSSDFAVHVFEGGVLNTQLARIARVGARAHGLLNITPEEFLGVQVPVPPMAVQAEIYQLLNALEREVKVLGALFFADERMRLGLLDQLIEGRLTVPAP